jgi:hypothetical protein
MGCFPVAAGVFLPEIPLCLQELYGSGHLGFGQIPDLNDICGRVIAGIVGQEKQDIQFHPGNMVFGTDVPYTIGIESFDGVLVFPDIQWNHGASIFWYFVLFRTILTRRVENVKRASVFWP